METSNSKKMMLKRLAEQISRVGIITRLVNAGLKRNKEPREWFNGLADMLQRLALHLSQLRGTAHKAEWPHPTGNGISQDDWTQQLNSTLFEIEDFLNGFTCLGAEINNIRIACPDGGSVNVVGNDEPIAKLKTLLETLDHFGKLSDKKIFGLDVAEEGDDEQIGIVSDEADEDEPRPVMVDEWPQEVESKQYQRPLNYPRSDYCRIQGFLRDPRVLQQVYRNWINSQSQNVEVSNYISTDGDDDEYLHKEAVVVLQWDPFDLNDSGTVMTYFNALRRIKSLLHQNVSKDLRHRANTVLHAAKSRLESMIFCLLNANASLHNLDKLFESSRQQSHWFCSSTSVSSSHVPYLEQDDTSGSYNYYSSTSYACPSEPSSSSVIGLQIMPSNEFVEGSDVLILQRFLHMVSQITNLVGCCNPNYNAFPELSQIFRTSFAHFLENTIRSLGFKEIYDFQKNPKVNFVEMKLPELKDRRDKWERAFKVAVLELLPWQKCLCQIFFSHIPEYTYICFHQVAEICINKLLNFASAAASAMPGNTDRVFHLLYVYEVVDCLSANITMIFSDAEQSFISERVIDTLSILKTGILEAFNGRTKQLEDDMYVQNSSFGKIESTRKDVDVHQATRNVMLYLKNLSIYRKTLDSSIFLMETVSSERIHTDTVTTFGQQAITLVTYLESNLEKKSSFLKNSNARHVFWINNLNHIVQEANGHNLRNLMAKEWVQEQHAKIDWHLINYTESMCAKALSSLNVNAGNWITLPSENSIKYAMKSFKLAIEEICNIQASWKVPDPILRAKLRDTVSERVLMAYTEFLETHKHKLDSKFFLKKSVYAIEDLEFSLQGIFEGSD